MKTRRDIVKHAYDSYLLYQRTRAKFDGTDKAARVLAADAQALLTAQRAAGIKFYSEVSLQTTIDFYKDAT